MFLQLSRNFFNLGLCCCLIMNKEALSWSSSTFMILSCNSTFVMLSLMISDLGI